MRSCPQHVVLVEVLVGNPAACIWHPGSGLMGWSVSLEQIALLHERGIHSVTLLLDGDDTGRRGRERVLPELSSSFFVRAPLLADGEKPTRCRNSSCLSLLTLISKQTKPAVFPIPYG
jgi:DNA primase